MKQIFILQDIFISINNYINKIPTKNIHKLFKLKIINQIQNHYYQPT